MEVVADQGRPEEDALDAVAEALGKIGRQGGVGPSGRSRQLVDRPNRLLLACRVHLRHANRSTRFPSDWANNDVGGEKYVLVRCRVAGPRYCLVKWENVVIVTVDPWARILAQHVVNLSVACLRRSH